MKLRRLPEDFRVDEVCDLAVGSQGFFAVYELSKRGQGTLEAIDQLIRDWKLPRQNAEHAGMKDRHAVTTQWITVRNGPATDYELPLASVKYLGQSERAITASDIAYNRFELVLRSLTTTEVDCLTKNLPVVAKEGVANYFDDQRFGSLPDSKEFIATAWIKRDYERALWLAFAEHLPDDDAAERKEKEILRAHWGDWKTCKAGLSRSHRRSVITFLDDKPGYFKKAWVTVNEQLRGIYLSALQGHLWNCVLNKLIEFQTQPKQRTSLELKPGAVQIYHDLTDAQINSFSKTSLHLPSARLNLPPGFEADIMQLALTEQGWHLEDLKVSFPRDRFFSKAKRPVMLKVNDLEYRYQDDELDSGHQKLTLEFSLPKGSYATMVVKRLMLVTT